MQTLKHISLIVAGILVSAIVIAVSTAWAVDQVLPARTRNGDNTRACVMGVGAATAVDCSNTSSASSAVLTADSRYLTWCTDDSYLRWGASAPTAAAGDLILPQGSILDFATDDTVLYVACKNINSDKACYYLKCN